MAEPRTCEHRGPDGPPCGVKARFRVSRQRRHDAQDSCGRHLAATVTALMQADDVPVTVQRITGREDSWLTS